MSFPGAAWVRWLCDPARSDELAGDLAELYARRAQRMGARRARARGWLDLVSVCVRQSRARSWTAPQWAGGGALAALLLAGVASAHGSLPRGSYTFSARDAAGAFTLRLRDGKVTAATLDENPFPLDRIVRTGARFTLLGAGGKDGGNLVVTLTPGGGIRWDGRPAPRQAPAAPIDLTLAHEYFAEFAAASAAEGGTLWGRPLYGPLLLVDPASRFVTANQSDSGRTLLPSDGVFTGRWPTSEAIANTAVNWGGTRWSMILWPLPADYYARRRLAFHELFHRIQPELGLRLGNPENAHLATRDGRVWLRLEWRALAEALIRRGAERRRAVADALLFRARRRSLFPSAAVEERALELNEGLAEYTGLRVSGLPSPVLADRAAVELGTRDQQESLSRSFAYASGPAYGILLDEAGAHWRVGLGNASDLGELLRAAYRLGPDAGAAEAERRAARYESGRIIAQETARAERAAAAEARLRARLIEGPTLSFPIASRLSFSFDPNGATPLAGIGIVYQAARVSDEWGVLTVESGGLLLVQSGGSLLRLVVSAPTAPTTPQAGEGWQLELAPGWSVRPAEKPGSWEVRHTP